MTKSCPLTMAAVMVAAVWLACMQPVQAQHCERCVDGYNCCDGNHCCADRKNTSVCCSPDETCCKGTCCIEQTTFCCEQTATHPDRCCPRWSICCPTGSVGCCTPEGIPLDELEAHRPISPHKPATNDKTLYTLFLETATLHVVKIDVANNKSLGNKKVDDFNTFGEMTRIFAFDGKRNLFHYVRANMSAPVGQQTLTLASVDPETATTTHKTIKGAVNFPTGFVYDCASDSIVFATQMYDQGSTPSGFSFYSLDIDSGVAKHLRDAANNASDSYSGWIHGLSVNGSLALRLGYKDVPNAQGQGVGVTELASTSSSPSWRTDVPVANGYDWYLGGIHALSDTADTFLSLAPRQASSNIDLIRWQLGGQAAKFASFGDSHLPRIFGPVTDTLSCSRSSYAAAVVERDGLPVADRWVFQLVDVPTGTATRIDPKPFIEGEIDSVSGLGIPE